MAIPLVSATTSAISGIRAASNRLDRAAASVASQSTSFQAADTVSLSAEGRAAAASGGGGDSDAYVDSTVDMRIAKYQNAASIKVLQTADDMTRDLLSIGQR